jgi:uncharacterized membrane protein
MTSFIIAVSLFVGTHFLMSRLRTRYVARMGETGFLIFYSAISLVTFGWMLYRYGTMVPEQLWVAPSFVRLLTYAGMFLALVMLAGSLLAPNPSLAVPGMIDKVQPGRGVLAWTRHPMMWGIALWAVLHTLVNGDTRTLILCAGMAILALVGARNIDRKKRIQLGDKWLAVEAQTSFVPFARQFSGRASMATLWPGFVPLIAGAILYALLAYFHAALFGVPAYS